MYNYSEDLLRLFHSKYKSASKKAEAEEELNERHKFGPVLSSIIQRFGTWLLVGSAVIVILLLLSLGIGRALGVELLVQIAPPLAGILLMVYPLILIFILLFIGLIVLRSSLRWQLRAKYLCNEYKKENIPFSELLHGIEYSTTFYKLLLKVYLAIIGSLGFLATLVNTFLGSTELITRVSGLSNNQILVAVVGSAVFFYVIAYVPLQWREQLLPFVEREIELHENRKPRRGSPRKLAQNGSFRHRRIKRYSRYHK